MVITIREQNRRFVRRMLLPGTILLLGLTLFPFLSTLVLSFADFSLLDDSVEAWIGFSNYRRLFGGAAFWEALWVTIAFTASAVGVQLLLGVAIATLLEQETKYRTLIRTIVLVPMVITPVAATFTFRLIFNPSLGVANYFLSVLGIAPQGWFAVPGLALMTLVLVDVWQWTPFVVLIVSGGLATLPQEPFEAAKVDGASSWVTFFRITLPMIRPFIIVAALIRLVDALKTFDIIYVLTGGGPGASTRTLNIFAFKQAIQFLDIGYASSITVVMLLLSIAITQVFIRRARVFEILDRGGNT